MDRKNYSQRRNFVLQLGKALHKFGTPAFRLEAHLANVCQSLGMEGEFMVSPTLQTIVLWSNEDPDKKKHNYHIRVKPGDLDLGALALADQLVDEVTSGSCDADEAIARLEEINTRPAPYNMHTTMLAFIVTSGAFAMLIGLSWANIIVSSLTGLLVFGILRIAEQNSQYSEALEALAATASALFASFVAHYIPGIKVPLVVLSGIIVFIPGLSITMALKDLAARHLLSGTNRLMDSLMCLCKLYFGSVLGRALGELVWEPKVLVGPQVPIPDWSIWLAVPLLSLTLIVVFKNRLRDIPWGVLSALIAYAGSVMGAAYLGDSVGPFVGALLVGIYSNVYSRIANAPSMVVLLHGIVLLVPGSKAYIGLNQAISHDVFANLPQLGAQAFIIFMSILAGMIFANIIFPSRKTL